MNFWFNPSKNPADPTFPLTESQVVAIRRNIEKMLGVAIGNANIPQFLEELLEGRYDDLEFKNGKPKDYGNPEILMLAKNSKEKNNKK